MGDSNHRITDTHNILICDSNMGVCNMGGRGLPCKIFSCFCKFYLEYIKIYLPSLYYRKTEYPHPLKQYIDNPLIWAEFLTREILNAIYKVHCAMCKVHLKNVFKGF